MPTRTPDPYYIVFIDEAGDPGLKKVRPIDPVGGTEWLCLGAVLVRATRELEVSNWVRTIMSKSGCNRADLHYRYLSVAQKRIALAEIVGLPLRGFVLASNKKNMRRYRNERAESAGAQQYNYCLRLLLERVTDFCLRHATKDRAQKRFVKIMYSKRSVHSYAQTAPYHELLRMQAKAGSLVLQKRRIMWEVLDWRLAQPISHAASPGAQLADVVTSAFLPSRGHASTNKVE